MCGQPGNKDLSNKSSFSKEKLLFLFEVPMDTIIETVNRLIWGVPVLLLILFVGIYLAIRTGFCQVRFFPIAIKEFFRSLKNNAQNKEGVSSYRALCTALAATVGTGNIAGVAGAIAIGGPGVVFWMWVCAILGMVTKFAEITLAIKYRTKNDKGEFVGGPMYMIRQGLPGKFRVLSFIYAFFGVVAAFGVGNATQVNAVTDSIKYIAGTVNCEFGIEESLFLGIIIAVLLIIAFRGGASGIGNWAEMLVPIASMIYIILALGIIILRRHSLLEAVAAIFAGAFSPRSVTCGVVSSAFLTLRIGASRGVFTNEAGMGTASIAHAGAIISHPVEQGMMGIVEVFLDTILICTLTALAILCSGVPIKYGIDPGITLTMNAFVAVYGDWCVYLITALVCILAFATILGWGLYGVRCAQYLFGDHVWNIYVCMQAVIVLVGIFLTTSVVWNLAEIVNGLMAIPNLIALVILSPEFIQILKDYLFKRKAYSSN